MIKDYLRLAFRSITNRRLRSWLTMIGIFIGIAAVVSLISLGQGMKYAINEQFSGLGGDSLVIEAKGVSGYGPPGSGAVVKLTEDDLDVIDGVRGVDRYASRLIRSIKAEYKDDVIFVFVGSMPDDKESRNLVLELAPIDVEEGRMFKDGDTTKIIVGDNFISKKRFEKKLSLRDDILLEGVKFEIIGKLKRTGNPQLDSAILIPEEGLRDILNEDKEIDMIVVKVLDGYKPSSVAEDIEDAMRRDRNLDEGEEDFSVQTGEQVIASLNNILNIVSGVLIGIAMISLLVGGIGIMNTMYTAVLERTREIGIMKSVGGRNKDIGILFLMESGLLGMAGGIIGVVLGISLSKSIEYIAVSQLGSGLLSANVSFWLIFGALSFSFLVGSLSGILPALQAAKLRPVDALRYE